LTRAERSLGTLGSGNHFIEVDQNEPGELHIVVHSGSRHLGSEVAKHYQEEAVQFCRIKAKLADSEAIAKPRGENNRPDPQDWQDQQNWQARQDRKDRHDRQKKPEDVAVPNKGSNESQNKGSNESPNETALKQLAYLSGALLDDYLHDMKLIQSFAALNRQAMTEVILNGLKLTEIDRFTTIHNYVDLASMILRKGAVSAKKGERLLIPLNMRDGSLICVGKGNDEWNQSAPHGAGRLMSRTEAKQKLSLKEFVSEMRGISSTSVNRKTLDESPMAYKPMNDHFADRPDGRRRRTSEASL
jgi:RNA-splicing ligase RtcB